MSTVKDTIERYQNKLKEEFNVLGKSYNRSTIGANGVANRKFLIVLFSQEENGIRFLQDLT